MEDRGTALAGWVVREGVGEVLARHTAIDVQVLN